MAPNLHPAEQACDLINQQLILPQARGAGTATLTIEALSKRTFTRMGLHRLEPYHSVHNVASCHVATAAKFELEQSLRGASLYSDGWHDTHLHARLGRWSHRDPSGETEWAAPTRSDSLDHPALVLQIHPSSPIIPHTSPAPSARTGLHFSGLTLPSPRFACFSSPLRSLLKVVSHVWHCDTERELLH
jgi:hypothetical protein